MKSKKRLVSVIFIVISLFLVACSSNKEPAAAAIKAAEDAFNAAKTEAVKYIPDQVESVEDAIRGAKASFEKGNFDEALNTARGISEKVKEMNASAAARKENLAKNWVEISGGVPEMLEAIKSRLDSLKASKRLPNSMNKARLEQAMLHYEMAAAMWDEAKLLYSSGTVNDVIDVAKIAKEEAQEAMKILEIPAPEAATK